MKILGSKALKVSVKTLLLANSHLRDSDVKLVANIWWEYLKDDLDNMSAFDLLKKLSNSELPSSEAITRCRRKLQEIDPTLRGVLWYKRHKLQEQVKMELKEIK
mgnify:CR=1 FL=1|jgi:hypothetical protein